MDKLKVKQLKLSDKDKAKLDAYHNQQVLVDAEWMLLAEFAKAYGWQAYKDARADLISIDELNILIEANRKLEAADSYRMAEAVFIGAGSVNTKRPSSTFKSLTRGLLKRMRIE